MNETNGIQIVERIDQELKKKNKNRTHLASALGMKPQTISAWYTRGTVPAADVALKISSYLNVSIEWLIFGTEPEGLDSWQRELLETCLVFDQRDKEDLLSTAKSKASRYTSATETKMA